MQKAGERRPGLRWKNWETADGRWMPVLWTVLGGMFGALAAASAVATAIAFAMQ